MVVFPSTSFSIPSQRKLKNTIDHSPPVCIVTNIYIFSLSGAQDDLSKVCKLAYGQVATYGMNPVIGPLSYQDPNGQESFQKPFSEDTGKLIDGEVRKLVNEAFDRTHKLLTDKKADVEKVAQLLLTKEVISREDMETLLGKRPFNEKTIYDEYVRPKPVSVRKKNLLLSFVYAHHLFCVSIVELCTTTFPRRCTRATGHPRCQIDSQKKIIDFCYN